MINHEDTTIQIPVAGVHPEVYSLNVLYGNGSGFRIRPPNYTNFLGAVGFGQNEKKSRGHEEAEECGLDVDVFHSGANVNHNPSSVKQNAAPQEVYA